MGRDRHAVPEDGDALREVAHLGEAMRDVDDEHPRGREAPGEVEQPLGLARGERRRRLVEDEDGRVARQRLGDLDHLAFGERQPPDLDVGPGDRDAVALEEGERIGPHLAGPHGPERGEGLAAEPDVLLDGEVGNQRQLLEDGRDAGALGGARIGGDERLAAQENPAFVGAERPGEDLDEGALAGAVLADEGVDLAGGGMELGARQGGDAAEALRNRRCLDQVHARPAPAEKKRRPIGLIEPPGRRREEGL